MCQDVSAGLPCSGWGYGKSKGFWTLNCVRQDTPWDKYCHYKYSPRTQIIFQAVEFQLPAKLSVISGTLYFCNSALRGGEIPINLNKKVWEVRTTRVKLSNQSLELKLISQILI